MGACGCQLAAVGVDGVIRCGVANPGWFTDDPWSADDENDVTADHHGSPWEAAGVDRVDTIFAVLSLADAQLRS
jgi:hypothetical protein